MLFGTAGAVIGVAGVFWGGCHRGGVHAHRMAHERGGGQAHGGSWLSAGGTPGLAWRWCARWPLGLALLVDWYLGEPPLRLHPVVWMGRYLGWAGPHVHRSPRRIRRPRTKTPFLLAGCWRGAPGPVPGRVGLVAQPVAASALVAGGSLACSAALPLLAWRMLRDEVLAVERALARSPEGREQLARLVSRDEPAHPLPRCANRLSNHWPKTSTIQWWRPCSGLCCWACPARPSTALPTRPMPCGLPQAARARAGSGGQWARADDVARGCLRAHHRAAAGGTAAAVCLPGRWPKRRAKPHRLTAGWLHGRRAALALGCGWLPGCTPLHLAGITLACCNNALRLMAGQTWRCWRLFHQRWQPYFDSDGRLTYLHPPAIPPGVHGVAPMRWASSA